MGGRGEDLTSLNLFRRRKATMEVGVRLVQ